MLETFSSCDLELQSTTLTFEQHANSVKVNQQQQAKYLGQRSLSSKVGHTQTHTHSTEFIQNVFYFGKFRTQITK